MPRSRAELLYDSEVALRSATPRGIHTEPNEGRTNDWLTPLRIIKALGDFDLDPCGAQIEWPTAKRIIRLPDDGLAAPWEGRVWLNPPYGPHAERWLDKLARHGNGTALVACRTETEWWFDHIWSKALVVFFLKGRLYFHYSDGVEANGNAGHGSALVAYGEQDAKAIFWASANGDIDGQCVRLREVE